MRKKVLFLIILIGLVSASSCVPACSSTDIICQLENIPLQTICILKQDAVSVVSSPAVYGLNNIYDFIITNPPLSGVESVYNDVLFAVESFFIIVLLVSALRLILSGILNAFERAKAKEDVKKVFFNMFLVWVSFDVYNLVTQLSNAFSAFLAPSAQEWSGVIFPVFMNPVSFLILFIAMISLIAALLFAVIRWVLVYVGLFLFPLSLALSAFPVTESFGRFFLDIIIINFVVQIVNALFMRIIVNLISTANFSGILVATGSLVLMILITLSLYLTAVFDAVSGNSWLRRF